MDKKLKQQDLLWKEADNSNDYYSVLRRQNLIESRHPRSPNFHMNKKYSIVFDEPSHMQLKHMLKTMQIDFPARTDPKLIEGFHKFLITNAKKLKIWEWYHTPIIVGTPRCCILKNSIFGIPMDATTEEINGYLEKNLPVLQDNGDIFRNRLSIVADKMIQLKEAIGLLDIKCDLFLTYENFEVCLDFLLDKKELLNSFGVHELKLSTLR